MFAIVRTGGKQYRVAAGDKIVVEKIAGDAGDTVRLDDVLLAGEGSDLRSTDGLVVSAEIIAQAKGDKVTVFKKRRRHNYRRKKGHRQQHTILRITAIGDHKAEKKPSADKPAKASSAPTAKAAPASKAAGAPEVEEQVTPNPAPNNEAQANPDKAAKPKKAAAKPAKPAAKASTKNAAPAKGAAKKPTKPKSPKAK